MLLRKVFKYVLVVGLGMALFAAHAAAREDLNKLLDKKNFQLDKLHEAYSKTLVSIRSNPAFEEYFIHRHKPETVKPSLAKIQEHSLRAFQRHGMDEMCLIDRIEEGGKVKGPEIARIVGDKIAPDSELSPDESEAPFYAPSFKLKDKEIRIQPPYVSPDSSRWVVAYTTPVVVKGKTPSFLHYERYWGEFLDVVFKDLKGIRILVVDKKGLVWGDSAKTINLAKPEGAAEGEKEAPEDYFAALDAAFSTEKSKILSGQRVQGKVTLDGNLFSFAAAPMKELGMLMLAVAPSELVD